MPVTKEVSTLSEIRSKALQDQELYQGNLNNKDRNQNLKLVILD